MEQLISAKDARQNAEKAIARHEQEQEKRRIEMEAKARELEEAARKERAALFDKVMSEVRKASKRGAFSARFPEWYPSEEEKSVLERSEFKIATFDNSPLWHKKVEAYYDSRGPFPSFPISRGTEISW